MAASSAVYRQAGGNTAITTGNMTVGDVIVMSSAVAGSDLDTQMVIDEVNTGENQLLAGHEYEIVSMGSSDGVTGTALSDAAAILNATSIASGTLE